ncbi:MFS transporter [Gordonia humi]|uniref:EmrB/QacA subfamily drug resistance transporter n=1 Tax=Gordonia humi TaxID=686429 RepID=A0A840F1P8_9ACTN|nr:EmrB/QacA subfamily drug resistance transporter [Gordonia humi]
MTEERTRFSRRQTLILGSLLATTIMFTIDITIVTVALPEIGDALDGATIGSLQWVIIGYTVTFGSLLLICGSLSDALGVRRMFLAGTVGFAVFSLACGLAPTMLWLNVARALQGVAAAVMFAVIMPLLARTFDESVRARAIGYWSGVVGVSGVLAPAVGGLLVDAAGWRWMFLINLPVAVIAVALIWFTVDDDGGSRPFSFGSFDVLGAVLLAGALTAVNLGVVWAQSDGWLAGSTLGGLGVFIVLIAVFAAWESRASNPLVDLRLPTNRVFGGVSALALLNRVATVGAAVYLVILLQDGYGYSAAATGLLLLPLGLATMVASIWAGRAQDRLAASTILAIGFGGLVVGSALLSWQVGAQHAPAVLIPAMIVWGAANGLANAPIMAVTTASVPIERVGMATGLVNSFFPIGAGLGTAVLGSVFAGGVGDGSRASMAGATSTVYAVVCGLMVVAVAVALTLSPRVRRPARAGVRA